MNKEELKERTRIFAHRSVKLALALPTSYLANHIKGQLIRASTSVAANYRAVCLAQSKTGFISKISIVIEEADKCCFGMDFIMNEEILKKEKVELLYKEACELTSIFIASRKTASVKK